MQGVMHQLYFEELQSYQDLIDYAKAHEDDLIKGRYEVHHITPRSLGGGDEPENLVKLTPFEHILAHKLLADENPGNRQLATAYDLMIITSKKKGLIDEEEILEDAADMRLLANSHRSEQMKQYFNNHPEKREMYSQLWKKKWAAGEMTSFFASGYWTEEQKQKQREKMTGDKNPNKRPEIRAKQIESHRDIKWWNNGVRNCTAKECPGPDWTRGRLPFNKSHKLKHTKWWNNGYINIRSVECPDGFKPGMLMKGDQDIK